MPDVPNILLMRAISAMLVAALLVSSVVFEAVAEVDGFSYSGDGVDVLSVEADIEFGEIMLEVESGEGGTLVITLDTSLLTMATGMVVTVDGQVVEPTVTTNDSMLDVAVEVPTGVATIILSGVADASLATESMDMHLETASDMASSDTVDMPASDMVVPIPDVSPSILADFVEPGVDISTYVDRYLHDIEFRGWYDQWYPEVPIYTVLGITHAEYENIAGMLEIECPPGTILSGDVCMQQTVCGPGTMLIDGICVTDGMSASDHSSSTAAEVLDAQGEGLQLGVAAVWSFAIAVGILLLLWIPSRIRKRLASRRSVAQQ